MSKIKLFGWLFGAFVLLGCDNEAVPEEDYRTVLSFESADLAGWTGGAREGLFLDSTVVHSGLYAGRIDRDGEAHRAFSSFTTSLPVSFEGETLELRGWLRTAGVPGFAGLWLRQNDRNGVLHYARTQKRNLSGPTGWTEYRISLPLNARARTVYLGAILEGEGTIWVDDLELFVDGVRASDAPPFTPVLTAVELDTEFDVGSGIDDRQLTPVQVENLALLGRVWGFAKYHHPRITGGEVNWDYELFRVLPSVLDAADPVAARSSLSDWLAQVGDPVGCDPCAQEPVDTHLTADIDWIRDRALLGAALNERLELIYDNRSADPEQYYVTHAPGVRNPVFSNEAAYADRPLPDAGYRLLALYRFWNIIEYWFPYRDVIGEKWEEVLTEFVPKAMAATTTDKYRLTMTEFEARINDTHANLWSHLDIRPPRGSSQIPVVFRFIEGKAVVTGYSHPVLGPSSRLRVGDVVETIDGNRVDSLVTAWRPYYSASNQPTRLHYMARALTKGEAGPVQVTGNRSTGAFSLTAERVPVRRLDTTAGSTHDLAGATFQRLSNAVAYLKLSSVVAADASSYIAQAAGAEILVIDIRNYPNELVASVLGRHLVTEPSEFARATRGDATNPGAFSWSPPLSIFPMDPHFSGATVILVDEVSVSQSEFTAMAFRASANAVVVGSTTAGADGDVSSIRLPGGIYSRISGVGVFYPDRTPTQRIGIIPDLEVLPTIEGIRAGRDEVLEAGVSHVLGREFRLPLR